MKLKVLCSVLAITAVFILVGCGSSSPSDVAKKWCAAIAAGKLEEANKFSHGEETVFINGMAIGAYKNRGKADSAVNTTDMIDFAEAEIVSEKINGNAADVELRDKKGKKDTVSLVKINGVWKVEFKAPGKNN